MARRGNVAPVSPHGTIVVGLLWNSGAARLLPPEIPPVERPTTDDDTARIGKRAAQGAGWVMLAFGASRALSFATNLFLARLLSPADFGIVSFAMILIGAFTILQDLGVPATLVYSSRDPRELGGTAMTINVAAAAILFAATVLLSPYLAESGGSAQIAAVVVVLALGLLVSALGSVQRALLVKELAFRRKLLPDLVPLIVGGIVSIVMAFMGAGAWSLVGGYLVRSFLGTAILWYLAPWRPQFAFRPNDARELLGYGRHASFNSVIGFIGLNLDYFIVGQVLGPVALGTYTLAFTLASLPDTAFSALISGVLFPAYTRIRHDHERLLRLFEDAFALICGVVIPLGLGLCLAGPAWVVLVFGERWAGVAEPLRLLAIFGILRAIPWGYGSLYKAIGQPRAEWQLNALRLLIVAPLLWIAAPHGLVAVSLVQILVGTLMVLPNAVALAQALKQSYRWLGRLLAPQVAALLAAGAVVGTWRLLVPAASGGDSPLLALLLAALASGAYLAVVLALHPRLLAFAMQVARGKIGGR